MSYKPCRSSGIMYDAFTAKSNRNEREYISMLESQEYLKFENLNRLSKHLYLYWLNSNKAHSNLTGRNNDLNFYPLDICAKYPVIIPILRRNINLVYKPLQKHLAN